VGRLRESYRRELPLGEAVGVAVRALASIGGENGRPRQLTSAQLEIAVLDRRRPTRKFRRLLGAALVALLPADGSKTDEAAGATAADGPEGPGAAQQPLGDGAGQQPPAPQPPTPADGYRADRRAVRP